MTRAVWPDSREPGKLHLVATLSLGVIAISFGSILVRLSQEAPSLTIAFYRMLWSAVIFTPLYWSRARPDIRKNWRLQILAGLCLALHFAFWISSLRFTTVAVSVLLVNTAPVFVAAVSHFIFGERLSTKAVLGLALAFGGGLVLFWTDLKMLGDWRGSVLALLGALMLAGYLIAGRRLRQDASLIQYVYPTYLTAAVVLGLIVLVAGKPLTGFSSMTFGWLFLLGLVPQCLGHTSYNWALRFLPATDVSTLILAEPILATFLAWCVLEEAIGIEVLTGAILVGTGIFLVCGEKKSPIRKTTAGENSSDSASEIAVVVLLHKGSVWIQRRKETQHLGGVWEFPGGKVHQAETPLEAARRELVEETGLALTIQEFEPLPAFHFSYPDRVLRLHFFLCRLDVQPSVQGQQGRWVDTAILEPSWMPPANSKIIEFLKSGI